MDIEDGYDLLDVEDSWALCPVVSFCVTEEFEYDGPYRWVIRSPNNVESVREGALLIFSPLDYGIWSVDLYVKGEDGEFAFYTSHDFENVDPDAPKGGPVFVPQENEGVN